MIVFFNFICFNVYKVRYSDKYFEKFVPHEFMFGVEGILLVRIICRVKEAVKDIPFDYFIFNASHDTQF